MNLTIAFYKKSWVVYWRTWLYQLACHDHPLIYSFLIFSWFSIKTGQNQENLVALMKGFLGRIICFCVCLSWNFKPSKAWNFNPSKAWKQLFVIVFRMVEISSFRRVEIKKQTNKRKADDSNYRYCVSRDHWRNGWNTPHLLSIYTV